MDLTKIILAPCISEKATRVKEERQYVFRVASVARKKDIAKAVEVLFDVEVEKVRVSKMCGKKRSFKNIIGKKQDWKKAYVTLKEGRAINLGDA